MVATDSDPVSHPKGRSMWGAVWHAWVYTHQCSWNREVERISRQTMSGNGRAPYSHEKILYNRMTGYFFIHLFMCLTIFHIFGMGGLIYQLWYSILMVIWLETVNYIEHYGLRRLKDENGVYESIGYQHSWSAVSSPVGFRVQRHSDHHVHSFRPM